MKRATALKREMPAATRLPYRAQVTPHIVRTEAGDYVQCLRLGGASFESADDDALNNWHERLNVLWRNVASANTALWVHVVRRRQAVVVMPAEDVGFAAQLAHKYQALLGREVLMVNVLFLILGCFMAISVLLLVFVPILMPIAMVLHIDLVHFCVVVVLNMMIGLIHPPFGRLLFVTNALT